MRVPSVPQENHGNCPGTHGSWRPFCWLVVLLAGAFSVGVRPSFSWAGVTAGEPGSQLEVYLVTIGPGNTIVERFGHNAIRIVNKDQGTDSIYTWARPDTEQRDFLFRFLMGPMPFHLEKLDFQEIMPSYITRNRTVQIQELNLTPKQKQELQDFLEWNVLPENRTYPFDYYRENCSTRVRDALDRTLDGQIREPTNAFFDDRTYRSITRELTANHNLFATVMALLYGRSTDVPLTSWEQTFIPMELHDRVLEVLVVDESGNQAPLVVSERLPYEAKRQPLDKAWPITLLALGAGLILGSLVALLGMAAIRGSRAARFVFTSLSVVWSLVAGLLGVLLIVIWTLSEHWYMYWNENLFEVNPLSLGLVVFLPMIVYGRKRSGMGSLLAVVIAAIAALGLALKVLPLPGQSNGEIIAFALPVHLAIAGSTWRIARR